MNQLPIRRLTCRSCNAGYAIDDLRWRCDCNGLLDLVWPSSFDPCDLSGRSHTLWRYREALPVEEHDPIVSFDEGFTPLTQIEIDGAEFWVKQDHLFPTGSYKDRGAAILMSHAKAIGVNRVVEDSSGNAGAAVAAYAARADISCEIFVPESTSPAKLAQIQSYGATLHQIPGAREDTARAVQEAAQEHFYASHVWSPFFFHGTKTCAYEIWEQLGFRAPDTVIIPTGNGTLLIGTYIGFLDLKRSGQIPKTPRLIAVQSANCAPLTSRWKGSASNTIAEGIAIAEPARAEQIRAIIRETEGEIHTVTDNETLLALKQMARMGFYIEPTSATAIAAFKKYTAKEDETVVVPLTGSGLKATEIFLNLAHNSGNESSE